MLLLNISVLYLFFFVPWIITLPGHDFINYLLWYNFSSSKLPMLRFRLFSFLRSLFLDRSLVSRPVIILWTRRADSLSWSYPHGLTLASRSGILRRVRKIRIFLVPWSLASASALWSCIFLSNSLHYCWISIILLLKDIVFDFFNPSFEKTSKCFHKCRGFTNRTFQSRSPLSRLSCLSRWFWSWLWSLWASHCIFLLIIFFILFLIYSCILSIQKKHISRSLKFL